MNQKPNEKLAELKEALEILDEVAADLSRMKTSVTSIKRVVKRKQAALNKRLPHSLK